MCNISSQSHWTATMMITSMQNKGLGLHSSPLYFTLLRSLNLPKQYPRWTSNICKYVEQMVSTDIPISENQSDWFKGVDMEVTVRNHIRQKLQNIKSQYISKIVRQIVRRRTIWATEFRLQFQRFVDQRDDQSLQQQNTTRTQSKKVYREHLPI